MDLSLKVPLVLTNSKLISSPTNSGVFKKRRLSECSDSSLSNSTTEKSALNDRFLELSLENQAKIPSPSDSDIKLEEHPSTHTITIPKVLRPHNKIAEEKPINVPPKGEKLLDNLFKMSQNDVQGISKYLNLDLNSKIATLNKMNGTGNPNDKFKLGSVFTSFLNSPFNMPFLRPDLLVSTAMQTSESQTSGSGNSDNEGYKFNYKSMYIGSLNQKERSEKVNHYLEKKKSRKFKHIRYNVRKDLADQRERVQGRFVKTKKSFSHSDLIEKCRIKDTEKAAMQLEGKNHSVIVNTLSLSSQSLGKRTDSAEVFSDNPISP